MRISLYKEWHQNLQHTPSKRGAKKHFQNFCQIAPLPAPANARAEDDVVFDAAAVAWQHETPIDKSSRKPQVILAIKPEEKELMERVIAKRGVSVSALIRLLTLDEAHRLGVE